MTQRVVSIGPGGASPDSAGPTMHPGTNAVGEAYLRRVNETLRAATTEPTQRDLVELLAHVHFDVSTESQLRWTQLNLATRRELVGYMRAAVLVLEAHGYAIRRVAP